MSRKLRRGLKALGLIKSRPENEVKSEYANLCAQAGELQYKIGQFEASLAEINKKLEQLNIEYTHTLEEKKNAPPAAISEVKA